MYCYYFQGTAYLSDEPGPLQRHIRQFGLARKVTLLKLYDIDELREPVQGRRFVHEVAFYRMSQGRAGFQHLVYQMAVASKRYGLLEPAVQRMLQGVARSLACKFRSRVCYRVAARETRVRPTLPEWRRLPALEGEAELEVRP